MIKANKQLFNSLNYGFDENKHGALIIEEFKKLEMLIKTERVTLIPLKIYANAQGKIKCEIGTRIDC